ncbi:hypothetical protein KP509_17G044800 [Ceratopteris richardii]|uniref:RRM domain-containing protein n=1 Tax=Ceratopteris richardii TaxID=49495 RepID=A0A8T2SUM5_CERRI|nr:hypothetical protein KP509_17G044800 [Ceratopteris richardii]
MQENGGHAGLDSHSHASTDERASKEGIPNETLWIGFPPPSRVDEDGLRKAFILFGEVERITTFPERSYCFVQFRNVDEATRAKEGLQGRLLNDPRILIRFSSNEPASKRSSKAEITYHPPHHVEMGGPRPFGSSDWSSSIHPPNRYPVPQHDISRNVKTFSRPAGGISAGLLAAPPIRGATIENSDSFVDHRLSPRDALNRPPLLEEPGVPEREIPQREHKRLKLSSSGCADGNTGGSSNVDVRFTDSWKNTSITAAESRHASFGQSKGIYAGLQGGNATTSLTAGNSTPEQGPAWRGSLAKAGIFVCRIQSFPIGKGIDDALPGVVNCVARTSLDTLAQHFFQAIDYSVICFIPDGEGEHASFQEFVSYLIDKHRAGVAKTSDKTTLFLVPPSDFTENVLKLNGDCIFGLVMNFPQAESNPVNYHQQPGLLPSQGLQQPQLHPAYVQARIGLRDELSLSTVATAGSFPYTQIESPQAIPKPAYSSGAPLATSSTRSHNDAGEANESIMASKVEVMEGVSRDAEARAVVSGSVQDHSKGFQASWSRLPGQTHPWDAANAFSTSTELNLRMPGADKNDGQPTGAMEQVMASLQRATKDPTVATQALLRQLLQSQSGASDGSDATNTANAVDALKMGYIRRDGGSDEEANNRFQATLQLAAALLQRMHDGKGSPGPTS